MKVIFLGTPEFGAIVLEKLVESKHEVVAVVTGIDKPVGRGNKVQFSPVKNVAIEHNLPLYQFEKIKLETNTLKQINADIMVTAAYGQILTQEIIDICPHKIINVHGSLLPKYRGATPIQTAILNGDKFTGVTIMNTEKGIDTGDILSAKTVEITADDNYQTLSVKLANQGAEILVESLNNIENNIQTYTKQDETLATHTRMITKVDALIDFNDEADNICNKIRAYYPNPVAWFMLSGESFKVKCSKSFEWSGNELCGTVVESSNKKGLIIKCVNGAVEIVEMQAPNSKMMPAKSYLNGKKIEIGSVCNG